jgi:hypothetical protein
MPTAWEPCPGKRKAILFDIPVKFYPAALQMHPAPAAKSNRSRSCRGAAPGEHENPANVHQCAGEDAHTTAGQEAGATGASVFSGQILRSAYPLIASRSRGPKRAPLRMTDLWFPTLRAQNARRMGHSGSTFGEQRFMRRSHRIEACAGLLDT